MSIAQGNIAARHNLRRWEIQDEERARRNAADQRLQADWEYENAIRPDAGEVIADRELKRERDNTRWQQETELAPLRLQTAKDTAEISKLKLADARSAFDAEMAAEGLDKLAYDFLSGDTIKALHDYNQTGNDQIQSLEAMDGGRMGVIDDTGKKRIISAKTLRLLANKHRTKLLQQRARELAARDRVLKEKKSIAEIGATERKNQPKPVKYNSGLVEAQMRRLGFEPDKLYQINTYEDGSTAITDKPSRLGNQFHGMVKELSRRGIPLSQAINKAAMTIGIRPKSELENQLDAVNKELAERSDERGFIYDSERYNQLQALKEELEAKIKANVGKQRFVANAPADKRKSVKDYL